LEFKVTQSSRDIQVLFYIKEQLGFGSVSLQDVSNKTYHYRIRDKKNILTLIKIFNGNIYTKNKNIQFKA
jgi:LAGLIDADG DNA endonuclease family protein